MKFKDINKQTEELIDSEISELKDMYDTFMIAFARYNTLKRTVGVPDEIRSLFVTACNTSDIGIQIARKEAHELLELVDMIERKCNPCKEST